MDKEYLIGGIDPGLSGGLVVINLEGDVIKYIKMPILEFPGKKKNDIDIVSIDMFFHDCDFICCEMVWASGSSTGDRKEGSASSFNFGRGYGYIVSWLIFNNKKSHKLVTPTVWKKYHNLLHTTKEASKYLAVKKSGNKFLATERSRKPHEGICEGFLIAEYARENGLYNKQN